MTSGGNFSQHGHELALRLRAAYAFLRRRTSAALAPSRMSSDQFVVLTVLAQHGPATQQELVGRCNSDTNTLGAMLVLLEARGLVVRTTHSADGRAWMVNLTRAGKALQKRAWNETEPLRDELAGLFGPDETRVLLNLLDRITDAMTPRLKRSRKSLLPENRSGKSIFGRIR